MPLTCDWPTKVITLPVSELTLVSPGYYTIDVTYWWQLLRELGGSEEGVAFSVDGVLYRNTSPTSTTPRIVDVINGYTVSLGGSGYNVDFINGNTNLRDVENKNPTIGVGTNNTAAAIEVNSGSGLSADEQQRLLRIEKFLRNRQVTNPATGKLEVYDDANAAIEFEAAIFEDEAGASPFDSQSNGILRRNRLETP